MALQYFRENSFFSDSELKEYRYLPKAGVDDKKYECGVTDAQAAFYWNKFVFVFPSRSPSPTAL